VLSLKVELRKAGESILYSGEMIIMRDAAQKRLSAYEKCPLDLKGKIVFYAGPAKTFPGDAIGAIGPTTSARMDCYLEMLFKFGVCATVGKGRRSKIVADLCQFYHGVYLIAPSGCAAALSKCVIRHEVLLFEDLQSEAIQRIEVKDFPLVVAVDTNGSQLF